MGNRGKGEGSVGRRKDGTYYCAVQHEGRRHWFYGATKQEVLDKLKEFRQRCEQGIEVSGGRLTVEAFVTRWLDEVVKYRNKPKTEVLYRGLAKLHIFPVIGKVQLEALRSDAIQRLLNDIAASGRAPRTVRNVRAVLRRALNQAVLWRYISHNPAVPVEIPRAEAYHAEPFTKEEAQKFLTAVKGHRLEALYQMALLLGLREGELLGLLRSDVNLDAGTIRVSGTLQWQHGKLVRETPKTKAGTRTLPLPSPLVPALKAHIEVVQKEFPEGTFLFVSTKGTPINPRNLVRQFKGLLTAAELRVIRFHDLRHTCATLLVSQGVDVRTVMAILGHAQVSTTLNIYAHAVKDTARAAVEGLGAGLL